MFGISVKRNLFVSVFAVLTVGSMALFFNFYEPWQPVGPELIPDGSFSSPTSTNGWSGWNEWTRLTPNGGFRESPGVVLTCSPKKHGILRFTVRDLTTIHAFHVSMRAATEGVVRGKEGYHVPRAIFFYHDAKARSLFNLHHGLMDISKNTEWKRYTDVFPVPAGAVNARLHIQNLGIAGVMRIDDVSVIPVRPRPSAPIWKIFFGTLWMIAFGLCLFALRPWARRYGFLITVTLFLIMTGIVLPGKLLDDSIEKSLHTAKSMIQEHVAPEPPTIKSAQTQQPSAPKPKEEAIVAAPPSDTAVDHVHVIGHFIMFSLLAFLSALSWLIPPSLKRAAAVFAGLALFSAATEVLQFIPADRSAGLNDLYVDLTGMAGAVALAFLLRSLQRLITRD
ncbi:MAG: VanZ family protein [Kiritimatiellales bacterium]